MVEVTNSSAKRKRASPFTTPDKKKPKKQGTSTIKKDTLSDTIKSRTPKKSQKNEEKRLRRFRDHAPESYMEKLHRATSQKMFVIDRVRISDGTDGESAEEMIEMAGTTGNVYRVHIGLVPRCSCPDNIKGNQCKHIIYVLHNVLKAPNELQYQLAFLSTELREIFARAPAPISNADTSDSASRRKAIEGDCPICFTELDVVNDEVVYCKGSCGNNIHANCFEQWAKAQAGQEVRCVYCRAAWEGDEEKVRRIVRDKTAKPEAVNGEGYVNVARELGLSGARDYSTYHQDWVMRQGFGYG